MIQLDRHIEILLLSNDCVIVPGLGGFMAHHVCARYYADTQSFLPPSRQLGFNSQLQINDSLLAQSYIEAYDISYPEALRRIDDEVNELKQKIQNEGYCELNDIGVLRLNDDGNLEFEPCDAGILTPNLYGLDHIDITPLVASAPAKAAASETETQPGVATAIPQPIPQLAKNRPATAEDEEEEEDNDEKESNDGYVRIRVSTLRNVATAAAVIAVLFVCALPFGKLSQPEISKSYLDTGILYNILPECVRVPSKDTSVRLTFNKNTQADSVVVARKAVETPETDTTIAEDVKPAEAKTDVAKPAREQDEHFFSIVLASRVAKANAEEYVKKLKASGFDKAEVLSRPSGTKVIYGHFRSEAEARTFLNNLRSSAEAFSDGWVMEI